MPQTGGNLRVDRRCNKDRGYQSNPIPMLTDQPEFCNDPHDRVPKNGGRNTKSSEASIGGKWGVA